ncbi:hypothetical protein [Streptomyces sp. AN091965]|uniref:hypothetical protein n=1 Tax=Streptomyces sp. AN091965 TaxID=2927803 RepID=UPI001F61E32D|nr:hypothetical protein [Streptomyces sp. AN091965]MCI3928020.1 hypothetical protein [Streptomyces sp. AN091965]
MADVKVEELLDDVVVRLPSAARVRALGGRRRARRRAGTGKREAARQERWAYEQELTDCGLTYRGGERPQWSGTATGDGSRLRVTVQQDGKWLSVVEVKIESP